MKCPTAVLISSPPSQAYHTNAGWLALAWRRSEGQRTAVCLRRGKVEVTRARAAPRLAPRVTLLPPSRMPAAAGAR